MRNNQLLLQKKFKVKHMVQETLIISNKELNEILEFVQALEDSNIFLRGVSKTIINETKELKEGFLEMLLGTLRASLIV